MCCNCKILEWAESESPKDYPQGRYSSLAGSSCNTEHVCRAVSTLWASAKQISTLICHSTLLCRETTLGCRNSEMVSVTFQAVVRAFSCSATAQLRTALWKWSTFLSATGEKNFYFLSLYYFNYRSLNFQRLNLYYKPNLTCFFCQLIQKLF